MIATEGPSKWYDSGKITAAGYSPAAMFASILLSSAIVLAAVGFSFRRVPSAMPVAGSYSFAIAAACHPQANDLDAAFLSVKWGVVRDDEDEAGQDAVGHCTFMSKEVSEPVPGRRYAGKCTGREGSDETKRRQWGTIS